LNDAVAALGGKAFLSMEDRVATGWTGLWRDGVARHSRTRIYTLYTGAGSLERQSFDKKESHWALFNQEGGFEVTFRGYRPMPEDRVELMRDDAPGNILHILRKRLDEPGLVATYRGMMRCENQSGVLVDIAAEGESVLTVCFSNETKLPISQSFLRRDPVTKERIEVATVFSRYSDAGGVLWPRHVARLLNGELRSELFLESVEVNQGLQADTFALPAELAQLK
jgi:hypothetical protein